MHFIRNISSFAVSVFIIFGISNSLEEPLLDSGILLTEEAIRNTTNKLFASLKLKRDNPNLNQYIIINKHFASLTLQDHDSLSEIARISRASNVNNNGSELFMAAINELLNRDNYNIQENEMINDVVTENHDVHIVDIIETFLKRLREARELYDATSYVKINENILNLIKNAQVSNSTRGDQKDDHYISINVGSEEIEFWKPSGRRIYAGDRTKIKHFPFMASIQMFNNFQCAGSIIKSDLIITASSCLQLAWNNRFFRENPAFLSVRVGSSFYGAGGEVIPVLEVYFHPSYDPKTLRNNICIMRLTRKIKFSWRARRRVRKIDIDRHANSLPYNTPGITILGWGAKGRSNIIRDSWQNILSFAVLDVYPLRECQEIYSKEYVTSKTFCAGFMSKGGGACNRDIGGPGIDDGTLVGVVSFGSPVCGAIDAPTVFTKLGYYADWIQSIMNQNVPSAKKRTTLKPKTPVVWTHTSLKPTTFKIDPVPGKMKPIPVNEIENVLRMFDDGLFHEFMRTMFDSKEMVEYQDVFKEVKEDMVNKILKDKKQTLADEKPVPANVKQLNMDQQLSVTSPIVDFEAESATKIDDFDDIESVETSTQPDYTTMYTVLDNEINSKTDRVDNNIAELIKNIDLKKIIEEETIAARKKDTRVATKNNFFEKMESQNEPNKKNESVLTLLYLSEERRDKRGKDRMGGNSGLSIPVDTFQDLTRTKGKHLDTSTLPEKELYEILSEVIDDEMRNIETR